MKQENLHCNFCVCCAIFFVRFFVFVHIHLINAICSTNTPLFHFRKLDTLLSLWNFYFPVLPQYQYGYQHVLKTPVLFWIVLEKMMSSTLIMIISLKVVAIPVVKFQVQGFKIQKAKNEVASKNPQHLGLNKLYQIWLLMENTNCKHCNCSKKRVSFQIVFLTEIFQNQLLKIKISHF